jgi:hypothetical protein
MDKDEALKLALEAMEKWKWGGDPRGADKYVKAIKAAIEQILTPAPVQEPQNFCSRCGKRTPDLTTIHTCTPPRGLENT